MRRSFALALASLTLASISVGLAAPGCGSSALDVQDLCGWIADDCNCYRRFASGVANMTVGTDGTITGEPKCGVALDSAGNALDPGTGAIVEDETAKSTYGTFSTRDKLDVCVLLRPEGGQVVFDPPIDVAALPLAAFEFKMLDGSGDICATGRYGSVTSFSIGFPVPEGTGSGGAGGGGGAGGDASTPQELCYDNSDPAQNPISGGEFSMKPGGAEQIVETLCPNEEAHRFNLYQLNKCDGSDANEDAYKALLPTAEIEADPGSANVDGYIRFRVFWPPTAAGISLDGQKPIAVEYFHCLIPGASLPCFDKALSEGETDLDCGGPCPVGCEDGQNCLVGSDCKSKVCETNAMGFLKCVSPPCGDLEVTGLETCDDGNTASGDGCSDTCKVEKGFNCPNPGTCVDIDECAEGTDNCPTGTECVNLPGSFTCACGPGQAWDGMMCVNGCGDGDLKAPEACDDGNITNGDGCTENCIKEPGYFCMGEGPGSCVDIDECATMADTCLDTENCVNTVGSFTCECTKAGTKECSNVCIDVSEDEFNCGDCDNVCLPNQSCVTGTCCPAPADALCGGACTDTKSDEANCGMCGNACMAGGTCVMGTCCELPNTACGTQCVNTQTSASHCGACDNACGAGLSCVSGKCCMAPANAVCGGACTDTLTDAANCGGCGIVCMAPTPTCTNGTCM